MKEPDYDKMQENQSIAEAVIQELEQVVSQQQAKIEQLEAENEKLKIDLNNAYNH